MIRATATLGAVLIVAYTAVIAGADAITKAFAADFAPPQLFFFSGAIVVALSAIGARVPGVPLGGAGQGLATSCPRAMALRAGFTVLASVAFFFAFRLLPFAEVFIFIGLIPLLAALMAGPILQEEVRLPVWIALLAGFIGVLCLFPDGVAAVTWGHGIAFAAATLGTASMVLARYIGRYETNALAQVFYPNAALCLTMGLALPFVWRPMGPEDAILIVAYAVLLFVARWMLVVALRHLAAHVATPLMNLQFVWMTLLGSAVFGEVTGVQVYAGAAVVVSSGLYLLWDQLMPERAALARG
ncbi:DMT family transporter [Pseudaestuariivita atlantica]|uniref:Membrane protein n=1 Tax=Pseudaestuariivita atlantica TaxID=1317121 RepID=A0A0L1JUM7_9RHOB|nr:DMT family transporter [Pseudaestuariivita atlantica]KNG95474.1 membrane protein [Pseudaestuariivita atlantica]